MGASVGDHQAVGGRKGGLERAPGTRELNCAQDTFVKRAGASLLAMLKSATVPDAATQPQA